MAERNSTRTVYLSDVVCISLIASELAIVLDIVKTDISLQATRSLKYTPVLDSGQRLTLSIHRLYMGL